MRRWSKEWVSHVFLVVIYRCRWWMRTGLRTTTCVSTSRCGICWRLGVKPTQPPSPRRPAPVLQLLTVWTGAGNQPGQCIYLIPLKLPSKPWHRQGVLMETMWVYTTITISIKLLDTNGDSSSLAPRLFTISPLQSNQIETLAVEVYINVFFYANLGNFTPKLNNCYPWMLRVITLPATHVIYTAYFTPDTICTIIFFLSSGCVSLHFVIKHIGLI